MIKKTTSQPPKEFCARLTECIELSGLSQLKFAEAVGFPPESISRWKLGDQGIRKSTAKRLADACGITVEQLYSHEPITQIKLKAQPETPQEFMPSTIEQQTAKPPAAKQTTTPPFVKLSENPPKASRTRYRNAVKAVADDLRAIIGDSKSTMLAVEYFAAKVEIRLYNDERGSL